MILEIARDNAEKSGAPDPSRMRGATAARNLAFIVRRAPAALSPPGSLELIERASSFPLSALESRGAAYSRRR